ncbi:MAG TPA: hypothetical protein VHW91_07215 [Candidatus Dormibacteraeota bacterium]|nr:hypothetical protein [Candidatus Dormibacteraeota bacterium]
MLNFRPQDGAPGEGGCQVYRFLAAIAAVVVTILSVADTVGGGHS